VHKFENTRICVFVKKDTADEEFIDYRPARRYRSGMASTAFQPIIDLVKGWSDKIDKAEDFVKNLPLPSKLPTRKTSTGKPPLATSWYYYGKPQPPRPGEQKAVARKRIPKK
jgi:hypothetical protein